MRVKQTLEFELEVHVTRDADNHAELWATEVDSDGGEFHYPKLLDEPELVGVIEVEQIPEGATDEQIIDAWFNSPYGVA